MFYKMIERKRDEWYASADCTVGSIISYMEQAGYMRDAQIDAIKTYLFLKIKCGCDTLASLFADGAFNTLDLDEAALPTATRNYLKANTAAAALYEYACQRNDAGEQVSENSKRQSRIRRTASTIGSSSMKRFTRSVIQITFSVSRWAQARPI